MRLPTPGLRGRMMIGAGVLVIVSLLIALAIFRSAQAELESQAFKSLQAVRESKATQIESTMADISSEVSAIAANRVTGEAITVTTYAFNGGTRKLDHGLVTITNDNRSGRVTETVAA